jgi:hypothetical protein
MTVTILRHSFKVSHPSLVGVVLYPRSARRLNLAGVVLYPRPAC